MQLATGVHIGSSIGYKALSSLEFYILVGVTGVGKTTTLNALAALGVQFSSLPDRREITDAIIFAGKKITDRAERFARTAAFRSNYPGGMAQALEQIYLQLPEPILFDGLRGKNEVQHAAKAFPKARFIALDAPDITRVQRLLGRNDAFDTISSATKNNLRDIQGIEAIFSSQEILQLEQWNINPAELEAKLNIVIAERQNYDPKAANAFLATLEPRRSLYLETSSARAETIAEKIRTWMFA